MKIYKHIPATLFILCLIVFILLSGPEFLRGPILWLIGYDSVLPGILGFVLYLATLMFFISLLMPKFRIKVVQKNNYKKMQIAFIVGVFLYVAWATQVLYRLAKVTNI